MKHPTIVIPAPSPRNARSKNKGVLENPWRIAKLAAINNRISNTPTVASMWGYHHFVCSQLNFFCEKYVMMMISIEKKTALSKAHATHRVCRSCQSPTKVKMIQRVIAWVFLPPSGIYKYLTIHLLRELCHDLQNPVNVKLLFTHRHIFSGVSIPSIKAMTLKNLHIIKNFVNMKFKVQNPVAITS